MKQDDFSWLQLWFAKHCDGDWEHDQIVLIRTFDNPGWGLTIKISGTELEGKQFIATEKDLSETDWFTCFLKDGKFEGRGGPTNLSEILNIFRTWTESRSE